MDEIRTPVPVSFEFFPPNTPVGSEKLRTAWSQELAATQARVLQRHLRRRRLDAREDAVHRQRDRRRWATRRRRTCRASAPRARASARSWPPTASAASAGSSRCAATCPAARRPPASSATPSDLVRFIRETEANHWHIEVAAYPEVHPQQRYAKRDLQHFADKMGAGADAAITQFFFNADAYFHFVDGSAGAGRHGADRSGHHALPQLRAHRAVRAARRHRDPALGGDEDGRLHGRRPRRSARSASTW